MPPYERANFRAIITVDPDDRANSVSVDTNMTFYLFITILRMSTDNSRSPSRQLLKR